MTMTVTGPGRTALDGAERDVLAVVLYVGHLPDAARSLRPADFGDIRARAVWEAIGRLDARGAPTDAPSVAIELERRIDQQVKITRSDLIGLAGECSIPLALPTYVRHVQESSLRREMQRASTMLAQAAAATDYDQVLDRIAPVRALLDATGRRRPEALTTTDLVEFLEEVAAENTPAGVIPDVLQRQERVGLTGNEGIGKSTWLRQIAVQTSIGVHPFTHAAMDPQRVLLLDLENPRRHLERKLRQLRIVAGDRYSDRRLIVESRSEGIDLLERSDRDRLRDLVGAAQPTLIVTGPLYKLAGGDPTEEKTAKAVTQALDAIRVEFDTAVILEAHAPHASNGQRHRPIRPYGASLWLRWPEFGINIGDDGTIRHWRGARDERDWPIALKRGGEWPWTVNHDAQHDPTAESTALKGAPARVLEVLRDSPEPLTVDELKVPAKIRSRETVSRALNDLARRDLVDTLDVGGWRGEKRWLAVPQKEV